MGQRQVFSPPWTELYQFSKGSIYIRSTFSEDRERRVEKIEILAEWSSRFFFENTLYVQEGVAIIHKYSLYKYDQGFLDIFLIYFTWRMTVFI